MGLTSFVVALSLLGAASPPPAAGRDAGVAPAVAPTKRTATGPARRDIKTVVDRVQRRYDGADDFRARFTQTLTNPTFNRKSTSSGEVLLKKPGRMRWNYEKPDAKMYLADGDLLWLYEPEDKQAFKQELKSSQLPAALAFLTGQGKLSDEFDISFVDKPGYGTPTDHVLLLQPKRPQAGVKSLIFVVDPTTFHVRESVLTDGQGNINDMVFSDVKVGTGLADGLFRWSPPAGTRVIDTAKMSK